ncbi:MAG: M81 family metallopeptidase [Spirochaetaceae bacterium]|nr:M81 family metallopeptidase [Spirochaetaceae bacterium]
MRILIGGMNHESNTFNPIITGKDDFIVLHGDALFTEGLLPSYASTGIIRELQAEGCTLVPTVLARAVPNGAVSASFYQSLKDEFLNRTKAALEQGSIDGVCLALHGSMKVAGLGCAEENLLASLRSLLPDCPFTVALDMHATITPALLRLVDGFVGYKTAPHVDCLETGAHAASLLLRTIRTGKKLHTAYRRIPMLIAGEKSETEAEPMRSLIDACRRAEIEPGILAASFLLGFPWADSEYNAVSVLVTTLDNPQAGEDCAQSLADAFWVRRHDFTFRTEHYDTAAALQVAYRAVLEEEQKPVFLSDSGDNPTAGATGDATDMLERILESLDSADILPTPLLYTGFYDEPAVKKCREAGVGAALSLTIGGNWDTINGKKIALTVRVENLAEDFGPYHAVLALISYRNLRIVLSSKHIGFGDDKLLSALGINAADYCLVVVKLGYLEPCFKRIATRAIMATTKGCSNEVLEMLPYRSVCRPLYPLDRSDSPDHS